MKKLKLIVSILLVTLLSSCNSGSSYEVILPSFETKDSISNSVSAKPSTSTACSSAYHYGDKATRPTIEENAYYTYLDDVALYIDIYQKLPTNFITKATYEAEGKIYGSSTRIGGDYFSNKYGNNQYIIGRFSYMTECDISSSVSNRGAKRLLINSNWTRIFYTSDHYETFQEYLGYKNWGPTFSKGNLIEICK
ncbi:MAG: hypothetical protein J1F31_06025 [Erysipelotrichales bacterium]|nr:hypothetical protein [Erysipelotrichales bacterium]